MAEIYFPVIKSRFNKHVDLKEIREKCTKFLIEIFLNIYLLKVDVPFHLHSSLAIQANA